MSRFHRSKAKPKYSEDFNAINAWKGVADILDGYAGRLMDGLLNAVKETAARAVGFTANPCGSAFDDTAYLQYRALLGSYNAVLTFYSQNRAFFVTPGLTALLDGVASILSSQVHLAADAADNPLEAESNDIMKLADSRFRKCYDARVRLLRETEASEWILDIRDQFLSGWPGANIEAAQAAAGAAITLLLNRLDASGGLEYFYQCYLSAAHFQWKQLTDLSVRPVLSYYREQLEKEYGILCPIIKIQVRALEQQMEKLTESSAEKDCADQMLCRLREAYQHLGRALTDTQTLSANAAPNVLAYPGFAAYVQANAAPDSFIQPDELRAVTGAFAESNKRYGAAVARQADLQLTRLGKQFDAVKSRYAYRNGLSEVTALAEEFAAIFDNIGHTYRLHQGALAQTDETTAGILAGLSETLAIKTDSLRESRSTFSEEFAQALAALPEPPAIPPEDAAGIAGRAADAFARQFRLLPYDIRKLYSRVPQAMEAIITGDEAFTAHRRRLERDSAQRDDKVEKVLLRYLRESLLYEIVTFEELLQYSVSRLRTVENEAVALYVAAVDKAAWQLEAALRKSGIEPVRPAPHEPFNARIHEVLMAEKCEGFAKGEIIKPVNTGYRRGEIVLLRANVIAAQ